MTPGLRSLRAIVPASLLCVAILGIISQVGDALAAATERDVTYRYFDEALSRLEASSSVVSWRPAETPLDRPFGPAEERIVGLALTQAWASHAAALETGSPLGLSDHFTGVALDRAIHSLGAPGARIAVLAQEVEPLFFHADGSLLQVETRALIARFQLGDDGDLEAFSITRDTNITTLSNETTGWRIFSHERRGAEQLQVVGSQPAIDRVAGINYYPADTPWSRFWTGFDEATIAADFARAADLGANSVRVFLHRDDFLDPDRARASLDNLEGLLDLAGEQGLSVVTTLFDMRGGYDAVTWANDMIYLERVLPILSASDHVAYVDLKNEPDLDMEAYGHGQVEAWAHAMLASARMLAPDLAYTIGWAKPSSAPMLADRLDLITYHDYGQIEDSAEALAQVRAASGPRPVHVTEIGETSFSFIAGRFPSSPEAQAGRLGSRLDALSTADGVFVWTLNDFPEPDPEAIGASPWVKALQSQYGLITSTGAPKPAAETVGRAFENFLSSPHGDQQ
jgi:hypothetical protein